jgi:hypothetical protein
MPSPVLAKARPAASSRSNHSTPIAERGNKNTRSQSSRTSLFHPVTFRTSRSRSMPATAANRSACGGASTALTGRPTMPSPTHTVWPQGRGS